MFLADKLQRLVDDFGCFDDPHERLAAVVDRARRMPVLPPEERTEANRVRGCVSVVWLVGAAHGGECHFRGDAESPIVRGLVVLLCEFFSGAPAAEIFATALDPLEALDLTRNLSPTRRNGLAAVRKAIRDYAERTAQAPPA